MEKIIMRKSREILKNFIRMAFVHILLFTVVERTVRL